VTDEKWVSLGKRDSEPLDGFPDMPAFLDRNRAATLAPEPESETAHHVELCGHCGAPATSADPLRSWDGPDGRPVLLHAGCEAAFMGLDP
jgi:hypothetical protein